MKDKKASRAKKGGQWDDKERGGEVGGDREKKKLDQRPGRILGGGITKKGEKPSRGWSNKNWAGA